jgi:hypothetical protein
MEGKNVLGKFVETGCKIQLTISIKFQSPRFVVKKFPFHWRVVNRCLDLVLAFGWKNKRFG